MRRTWHAYRRQVLGVALLSPLAYILVLFALAHAPVSYVAPARELSILVGAVAGITVLDEGHRAAADAGGGGDLRGDRGARGGVMGSSPARRVGGSTT